jgi:hypothetical protein
MRITRECAGDVVGALARLQKERDKYAALRSLPAYAEVGTQGCAGIDAQIARTIRQACPRRGAHTPCRCTCAGDD